MSSILVINLFLVSVIIALLIHYRIEKKAIRDFAIQAVGTRKGSLKVVLELVGIIYHIQKNLDGKSGSAFISLPLFSILGMSPASILNKGGCCSHRTR